MAPFKSSLSRSAAKLLGMFNQTDLSLRGATQNSRFIPPPPFSATGGNQSGGPSGFPANGFKYHTFTSDGNFVVADSPGTVEVLIVGGGGGGADYEGPGNAGAGGGAGGLVHHASFDVAIGTYPIVVGDGGPDNPSPHGAYIGEDGGDSSAFGMVAKGGGGAGGYTSNGRTGGSGGGGDDSGSGPTNQSSQNTPFVPNPDFNQYGHAGGDGAAGPGLFGGGGGAGAAGSGPDPGAGGVGRQYPQFVGNDIGLPAVNFTNGYYAGGGGGGRYPESPPAPGGLGGGGGPNNNPSGAPSNTQPIPGTANTGGGGAGGSLTNSGGTGGSGIVIIKYPE